MARLSGHLNSGGPEPVQCSLLNFEEMLSGVTFSGTLPWGRGGLQPRACHPVGQLDSCALKPKAQGAALQTWTAPERCPEEAFA